MRRCRFFALVCILIISLSAASHGSGGRVFSMTKSEMADAINQWFDKSGFAVSDSSDSGSIGITAVKGGEKWLVRVRPHSPIACEVEATYSQNGTENGEQVKKLWNYLSGYTGRLSAEVDPSISGVPSVILSQNESVVCLSAKSASSSFQFSGSVIDAKGLILCTAHNLNNIREVRITCANGRTMAGRILGADFAHDVALIGAEGSFLSHIQIPDEPKSLALGERLFSVGCPENLGGTVYAGFISGPPRLADKEFLLQARMKVYPGSSGSPVFDGKGRFVAMVKGRYRGTDSMGFLIPHETILAFLRDQGIKKK